MLYYDTDGKTEGRLGSGRPKFARTDTISTGRRISQRTRHWYFKVICKYKRVVAQQLDSAVEWCGFWLIMYEKRRYPGDNTRTTENRTAKNVMSIDNKHQRDRPAIESQHFVWQMVEIYGDIRSVSMMQPTLG